MSSSDISSTDWNSASTTPSRSPSANSLFIRVTTPAGRACIGIGLQPPPEIASVDLLNFQDRRVWLITKAPHRYPHGRGLQPGHEPVCSDLTDPCQHTMCG
jgi:hypothetical protein